MLETTDLVGVDEGLALQIIGFALTIAPCLDELPEGRNRKIAVAVLSGIAKEAKDRGSRLVKAQRIGTASVDYSAVDSWFSPDARATLRSSCTAATATGTPMGSFPKAGILNRLWPEESDDL